MFDIERLVGRDREVRLLCASLRPAPSLVLVVGEAGIGKTRLLREVAREPEPGALRWLVGQCHPLDDPAPLAPVVEALGAVTDEASSGALATLMLAGGSDPDYASDGGARSDRHWAFAAVVDLLSALGPAVLCIEDLHWADAGTLRLLRFVASRLPHELRLVGTYRPEDTQHAAELTALAGCVRAGTRTAEVRLRPLTPPDVHQLAAQLLGVDRLPADLVDDICERTGGLPFVVEELLRDVLDAEQLDRQAVLRAMGEARTPVALRASVTVRLEQVSDVCRQVVWAAAVLDSPVTDTLLGAVADIAEMHVATALDTALARGLLGQPRPGMYDLRHALARRAVYETIPADQLRRLHRRAATALAAVEPASHARIAHHCRQGGLLSTWMAHAELAADSSALDGDSATAAGLLTDVLLVDALPGPDRARLAVKLGDAALSGHTCADAATIIRTVLADPKLTDAARGRLRLMLGLLLHHMAGDIMAARRELATAITELADEPDQAARAMAALSVPTFGSEGMSEHRGWLRRALRTADVGDSADARTAVRVSHAMFLVATGDPAGLTAAQCVFDVPRTIETRRLTAAGAAGIASALACLGHDRDSAIMLDRATEIAVPADIAFVLAGISATRLRLAFAAGDWADIPDQAARVRAHADEMRLVGAEIDLVLGRLRLAHGELARARQTLDSVVGTVEEGGPVPIRAAAVATLGRLHLANDLPATAMRETERCVAAVRRKDGWVWAGELVAVACLALHRYGRRDAAHMLVGEFADGLADRDAPASSAACTLARAGLAELDGDLARAIELFESAAARYRVIGRPYEDCIAMEGRGRCLLAAGHPDALASTALAYEALGARWDSRRCRDALRHAGVAVSHRRGRRGYGNALSPREREVAQLAARGMRNVNIAATLSLSVSTVEDHLSKAMRKLNVRSRRDLAPLVDR